MSKLDSDLDGRIALFRSQIFNIDVKFVTVFSRPVRKSDTLFTVIYNSSDVVVAMRCQYTNDNEVRLRMCALAFSNSKKTDFFFRCIKAKLFILI